MPERDNGSSQRRMYGCPVIGPGRGQSESDDLLAIPPGKSDHGQWIGKRLLCDPGGVGALASARRPRSESANPDGRVHLWPGGEHPDAVTEDGIIEGKLQVGAIHDAPWP